MKSQMNAWLNYLVMSALLVLVNYLLRLTAKAERYTERQARQ